MTVAPRAPSVEVVRRPDGELLLSCPIPPVDVGAHMIEVPLERRADDVARLCQPDDHVVHVPSTPGRPDPNGWGI